MDKKYTVTISKNEVDLNKFDVDDINKVAVLVEVFIDNGYSVKVDKFNTLLDCKESGYVPCEVSERWIQFPRESDSRFIDIHIMTRGLNDDDRKICTLYINKADLLRGLNSVEFTDEQ